jgi:benzoyl-CoA reductase subunit C
MIEQFKEWEKNRHEYAKEWKARTGGKVMGYFCTYVPEEILYAAGILPVRVLGSHEPQDVTEPHIFAMFCPFCRDCLAQGLKGRYDYLNGLMIAQSCLHIRQAFWSWQKHVGGLEYSKFFIMPHKVQSKDAPAFLRGELAELKKEIEEWTGREITDEALDNAIAVYNKNRELMRKLYELRKLPEPPISGEEAMEITMAMQMVDKADHNKALEELLEQLPTRPDKPSGTRLMIVGSEDDDLKFLNMVETSGGLFVIDDHCTGSRYFWNQVEPEEDRLMAIAKRYINRPPCPSKDWEERARIPHIVGLAKDWDVSGAIIMQQKFCDPHELDFVAIKKALEENGVPTLFLEFDVTVPIGQFKIRSEAFLEMIGEEDLF